MICNCISKGVFLKLWNFNTIWYTICLIAGGMSFFSICSFISMSASMTHVATLNCRMSLSHTYSGRVSPGWMDPCLLILDGSLCNRLSLDTRVWIGWTWLSRWSWTSESHVGAPVPTADGSAQGCVCWRWSLRVKHCQLIPPSVTRQC